jgi:hypothetical protein
VDSPVGCLQQLVCDFLVLCCMHVVMSLSVDRVLTVFGCCVV